MSCLLAAFVVAVVVIGFRVGWAKFVPRSPIAQCAVGLVLGIGLMAGILAGSTDLSGQGSANDAGSIAMVVFGGLFTVGGVGGLVLVVSRRRDNGVT